MLKNSAIINTWRCDSCGTENVVPVNPFIRVIVQKSQDLPACEIDLCQSCIAMITVQSIEDYIANS